MNAEGLTLTDLSVQKLRRTRVAVRTKEVSYRVGLGKWAFTRWVNHKSQFLIPRNWWLGISSKDQQRPDCSLHLTASRAARDCVEWKANCLLQAQCFLWLEKATHLPSWMIYAGEVPKLMQGSKHFCLVVPTWVTRLHDSYKLELRLTWRKWRFWFFPVVFRRNFWGFLERHNSFFVQVTHLLLQRVVLQCGKFPYLRLSSSGTRYSSMHLSSFILPRDMVGRQVALQHRHFIIVASQSNWQILKSNNSESCFIKFPK